MKTSAKIVLFMTCFVISITNLQAADKTSKKTMTKSFTTSPNATLEVFNEFGNIHISEWDKDEISFEATLTATAKSQQDADKMLNTINVSFTSKGSIITAQTKYGDAKNCKCSRSVDYLIRVPKNIHYNLKNEFGNINMANATGNVQVELEYGNYKAGNLNGNKNHIGIEFGSHLNIAQINGNQNQIDAEYSGDMNIDSFDNLNIKAEFSTIKLGTGTKLDIQSEYTTVNIQKVQTLNFKSEFESYTIGEVDVLFGSAEYTNLNIKQVNKSIRIPNLEFGGLEVNSVSAQFESIDIKSEYAPIDIHFDAPSFHIDATSEFGKISLPEIKSSINQTSKDQTTVVTGIVGTDSSPKAKVKIKGEFANIKLK